MKTSLAGPNAMSRIRVFLIATCIVTATPHLFAEITLVTRLSDARAGAHNLSQQDNPPPATQTDFTPANLGNSAMVSAESGFGTAHSASISSVAVDQSMGTMRVTGSGTADAQAIIWAGAAATAKVIALSFTLTGVSYRYSLSGQMSGSVNYCPNDCASAKLQQGSSSIFELTTDGSGDPVTLSETGTLSPGNYTLSVDVNSGVDCSPPIGCGGSSLVAQHGADFTFALDPAPTPSPTSSPTPGGTATPSPVPVHPINLSTRVLVQSGDGAAIGGFIISGTDPKQVALRGLGPSLTSFGVPNALADPVLELHGPPGFPTVINDDFCDLNPCCGPPPTSGMKSPCIIPPGIAPTNGLESLIFTTLDPGAYTVIMRGNGNPIGVGLVELDDESQLVASLANLSTRAFVGTDSEVVIAGLIIVGDVGYDEIVVRGLGPSLASAGVPNALVNPMLELYGAQGEIIRGNDNWQDDSNQAAELMKLGLAPANSMEAGMFTILPPGLYTAVLSGATDGTGVGLVEVYDLGPSTD